MSIKVIKKIGKNHFPTGDCGIHRRLQNSERHSQIRSPVRILHVQSISRATLRVELTITHDFQWHDKFCSTIEVRREIVDIKGWGMPNIKCVCVGGGENASNEFDALFQFS